VLCIYSKLIGVEKHLVINDDGTHFWSEQVPDSAWILGNESPKAFDLLLKVSGQSIDVNPPESYVNAIRSVYPEGDVPWRHVLPRRIHQVFLRRLLADAKKCLNSSTLSYFEDFWKPIGDLHGMLRSAHVDVEAWSRHCEEGKNAILESFSPGPDGMTSSIIYNRFASRTGRLGVESGPMILNLKKSMRDVIDSTHGKNGKIVSMDFNALEARIILYESGKLAEGDLYANVASNAMPNSPLLRSVAKACIISELYGISQKKLAEKLSVPVKEASRFMSAIRGYFDTPTLVEKLKTIHEKEGCIYNKFGRRLFVPDNSSATLLNTYAQSTGADAAQLGFLNVMKKLHGTNVRPLFVLHDALILDVHNDDLQLVNDIKEIDVPMYEQKFPLKCENFYTIQSA
jgi:hypothetical protein